VCDTQPEAGFVDFPPLWHPRYLILNHLIDYLYVLFYATCFLAIQ
jgi:hypothetical protein